MFAVMYRWRLKAGREEQFADAWAEMTDEFLEVHGGLGSCLHKSDDGLWVAYARWPNRKTWEKEKGFDPASDPGFCSDLPGCKLT